MLNRTLVAVASAAPILAAAGAAGAQEVTGEEVVVEEVAEPVTVGQGWQIFAGGGVEGFFSGSMRDVTSDVGGNWDVRVILGSRSYVGFEAGYSGFASNIDSAIGPDRDGTLIGTTLEGTVRWNFMPADEFTPYVFGGLGWRRYDIIEADFSRSATGLEDSDDLMVVPLGAGLSYRFDNVPGLTADARFTFRPAIGSDLLLSDPGTTSDDTVALHTWGIGAFVGYEF